MSDLNVLFRKRIGFPEEELTFEKLDELLVRTAEKIPFENLCIMENRTRGLSNEIVMDKILLQNEGGLCYELNYILYLFLQENGFDTSLVRGVVFNQMKQEWSKTGKTHVANLVQHNGKFFLVDTGFGGNLPLKPVPLSGETVSSATGDFRVEPVKNEHGDYLVHIKLNHKDQDWKIGYVFDSMDHVKSVEELEEIQTIIKEHPESAFNKRPLITKLTSKGNMTLTTDSFTEWEDGQEKKKGMDEKTFKEYKRMYFGL
ncbi:N-hydroxyarylamine O-acetyltransferase [Mesobacillus persicus]|uniref:N-hydroxyarylamine O-acetyltransferase n=1 Tax=Mesobacillus persicus TaxID=930146 RepID=A0A1H8D508_9BACI|nr:arylamine N-acetyltransferase [Mesobacillus persicus]SEN01698.1 N-hydroxyarylamine O-acetyltransferase [Mesobacillus persicus]